MTENQGRVREQRRRKSRNYRKGRRKRKKGIVFLTVAIVILLLSCGVVLHSLPGQPITDGARTGNATGNMAGNVAEDMTRNVTGNAAKNMEEKVPGTDSSSPNLSTYDEPVGAYGQVSISSNQPSSDRAGSGYDKKSSGSVPDLKVDLTQLYSPYAVLVDCGSGKTLAEQNARTRIYPASLTKLMTALLAVENTADMEEVVTVPEDIFGPLYEEDASMAGFQPGERASLRDLLYGILLPSGAECCMTFACRIAGSEDAFVEMMNRRAEELGLVNTHFCNATGLHDPDHYSTVEDLSLLLQYALQNTAFKTAFTGSRYSTSPTREHPDGFTFVSSMFRYMDSAEVTGGRILGGKTGYTEEAGQCLASLAEVGGKEYILVTAGAAGSHETEQFHILDAQNVYSQIGACLASDDSGDGSGYWWER